MCYCPIDRMWNIFNLYLWKGHQKVLLQSSLGVSAHCSQEGCATAPIDIYSTCIFWKGHQKVLLKGISILVLTNASLYILYPKSGIRGENMFWQPDKFRDCISQKKPNSLGFGNSRKCSYACASYILVLASALRTASYILVAANASMGAASAIERLPCVHCMQQSHNNKITK